MVNHSDGYFQNLLIACSWPYGGVLKAKKLDVSLNNRLIAVISTMGGCPWSTIPMVISKIYL